MKFNKGLDSSKLFESLAKGEFSGKTFIYKAVVGGTAGPAMAGPFFWPKMVLAGPLFGRTPFRPIILFLFFAA